MSEPVRRTAIEYRPIDEANIKVIQDALGCEHDVVAVRFALKVLAEAIIHGQFQIGNLLNQKPRRVRERE